MYPSVELLGHVVIPDFHFEGTVKVFSTGCTVFLSLQPCMKVPVSSHPHQHLFSMSSFSYGSHPIEGEGILA